MSDVDVDVDAHLDFLVVLSVAWCWERAWSRAVIPTLGVLFPPWTALEKPPWKIDGVEAHQLSLQGISHQIVLPVLPFSFLGISHPSVLPILPCSLGEYSPKSSLSLPL